MSSKPQPLSEMASLVAELHRQLTTTGGTVSTTSHPLKVNLWVDRSNGLRYKVTHVFQESLRVIEIRTNNSSERREINRFLFETDIKEGILQPWSKPAGSK